MKSFLVLLCAAMIITISSSQKLRTIAGTGLFKDTANGMTYLFHGGNHVDKAADISVVTDENIAFMQQYDLTLIRFGFIWSNAETAPGVYNMTYVNAVKAGVDKLWSAGIRTFLDMHQDCHARYFCTDNDNVPDFYGHAPATAEYSVGGAKAFPLPIAKPLYNGTAGLDLPWGRISNCDDVANGPFGWATCYCTYAAGAAAQRLWDNADGGLDALAAMWQMMAGVFKGHPGVLGYEVINEPWLGDVPLDLASVLPTSDHPHWDLWFPGVADKKNLQPAYQRVHEAIRKVDDETIIMFEPATGGNILDAFPVGFTSPPGGAEYADRSLLSYHVYCPLIESDMPYDPSHGGSEALQKLLNFLRLGGCKAMNSFQYEVRARDAARLGVGALMSEFGAVPTDADGIAVITFAMDHADVHLHSWTYWDLGLTVKSASPMIRDAMCRTYMHATWGVPMAQNYVNATNTWVGSYVTPGAGVPRGESRIYVSRSQFPAGVSVSLNPDGVGTAVFDAATSYITISHTASVLPQTLVTIYLHHVNNGM